MKLLIFVAFAGAVLLGCATMGLSSRYGSEGPVDPGLLNGPIAFDFKNPKVARKKLGRGKKMFMAGATVDAHLITPPGEKLDYLAEAQRTRESRAVVEAEFEKIERRSNPDRICFVATLTHATIDLAKASAWKFKVSIDEGAWITLPHVGSDDVPNYSVSGGNTEWFSAGVYCGEAKNWAGAKRSIRLNVFPPVFVNPGEAVLTWAIPALP